MIMYTCILNYIYIQDSYVYMQDNQLYMQDIYAYMQDNYEYIITWYFFSHKSKFMKKICSDVPSGPL